MMKKLLALVLVLVMAFGMVACGGEVAVETPQSEQAAAAEPEVAKLDAQALAEQFADGLFTPDIQAVFDLMPFDLALEQLDDETAEAAQSANDELIAELQLVLDETFANVDMSWTVEVLSEEAVEEDELASLNEKYADYELTVDEASAATAAMKVIMDGVEISANVRLVFVLISDNWYMDIDSLSVLEEMDIVPEEADTFDAEYMVGSFMRYMLTPDFMSLIGMMPPALQEAMMAELGEEYEATIMFFNDMFAEMYALVDGVERSYSLEITAEEELSAEALAELNEAYGELGVTFDSAISVDFTFTVSTMDEELPMEMTLVFVEQDGEWYLDTTSMEGIMG